MHEVLGSSPSKEQSLDLISWNASEASKAADSCNRLLREKLKQIRSWLYRIMVVNKELFANREEEEHSALIQSTFLWKLNQEKSFLFLWLRDVCRYIWILRGQNEVC